MADQKKLLQKFADRFGVEPAKLWATLKATAFRVKDGEATDEQMMALLIVADQYSLNPFTREIFAFPDKQNGIVPVVSVDGWSRIINERPELDGIEFAYSEEIIPAGKLPGLIHPAHAWIECLIHRKDRKLPVVIREWLEEVYRPPFEGTGRDGKPYKKESAWQTHTRRFHRHKTLIQASRIAFGFAGIYDEDEAQRIVDVTAETQIVEKRPLRESVKRAEPTPQLEEKPAVTLQSLLGDLSGAESDERIDYLTSIAREHLSDSGQQAFHNAAKARIQAINGDE